MKLEVWSMRCAECGDDMQPRFLSGSLYLWWCLGCGVTETPEEVEKRAVRQCEVCDD